MYLIGLSNKWLEFQRYLNKFRKTNDNEKSSPLKLCATLTHPAMKSYLSDELRFNFADSEKECLPKEEEVPEDKDKFLPKVEKTILSRDTAMNIFLEYHSPYLKPLQVVKLLSSMSEHVELKNKEINKAENISLQRLKSYTSDNVIHDVRRIVTEMAEYVCEIIESESKSTLNGHKNISGAGNKREEVSKHNGVDSNVRLLQPPAEGIKRVKSIKFSTQMDSITEATSERKHSAEFDRVLHRNTFNNSPRTKLERPKTLNFHLPIGNNGNRSIRNSYCFGYHAPSPESPSKQCKYYQELTNTKCTKRTCSGYNIDSPRNVIQSPRSAGSPVFLMEHLGLTSPNKQSFALQNANSERFCDMPSPYFAVPDFKIVL